MKGKVVIVTGASSGIGRALALRYAQAGYRVVVAARNAEKLDALVQEIEKLGTQTLAVPTDVTKKEDCEALAQAAKDKFGRIDGLINNAGISMRALFQDVEVEVIEQLMAVNFFGAVYCTKYALDEIIKAKGFIVGVSSIAGYRGLPARTGYSASKFALQGFLESLRTELLKTGVNVLTACPGFTESNIRNVALTADGTKQGESPLKEGKLMTADQVADYIFKAVKKGKRSLVLTGQGKMTVFLNKFAGKFMDKMVFNHFAKEPDSPLKK